MDLRLQYPPTPENAVSHAQIAVDAAWNVQRIRLDFSPQSLEEVDRIVGRFHVDRLQSPPILTLVFCFGCYVGEVLVRHNQGVWKMPEDAQLPDFLKTDNNMMCVELPNGTVWNPIGKTFKLLGNGQSDGVAYFYHVATKNEG
jgi:hypothetical protein